MLLLETVPTDGIIIESGIFYQSNPFAPPRWNVAAVVLVEVLAEEGCKMEQDSRISLNVQNSAINALSLCFHAFKNPFCSGYLSFAMHIFSPHFPKSTAQHSLMSWAVSQHVPEKDNCRPTHQLEKPQDVLQPTGASCPVQRLLITHTDTV